MDDTQLEKLTVKELLELKNRIDLAIRAVIRAKRRTNAADPMKIDLERERDAWLSAKR